MESDRAGAIRSEIEQTLGYVPTVFEPAAAQPQLLENLWTSLRDFYVLNPLPDRLKDLLIADLSHACGNPFCVAVIGCDLISHGRSSEELIELHERIAGDRLEPDERRILALSRIMFLRTGPMDRTAGELQELLGDQYPAWAALLGTIAFCHRWVEAFSGPTGPLEDAVGPRLNVEVIRRRLENWRESTRIRRRLLAVPDAAARPAVLVVDDHREIRDFLRVLLEGAGYAVEVASDGREAIEALDKGRYNLLLTDIHMPGLGGVETARQIRRDGREIPILLMSSDLSADTDEAVRAGLVQGFFPKPFHIERLLGRISELTGRAARIPGA